jgi:hypothetical protein
MTLFFGYATCCANAQREELLELASVFFPTLCSHYNFPFSSGISMSLLFLKGEETQGEGVRGSLFSFIFSRPPSFQYSNSSTLHPKFSMTRPLMSETVKKRQNNFGMEF